MRNIIVPAGIKEIGAYWFWGSGIESVQVPASVENIGEGAFYRCRYLSQVVFAPESKLERIGM